MPVCSKFRKLLVKLATECSFKSNSRFLKQVDSYTMGRPLSVTFSDNLYGQKGKRYCNTIKTFIKIFIKIFHGRFVDDIYSADKIVDNVLFNMLNNYHLKIKRTI